MRCRRKRFGRSRLITLSPSKEPSELCMSVSIGGRELRRLAQYVLGTIEVISLPQQITQMPTVMRIVRV